jgi:hypothetical protein
MNQQQAIEKIKEALVNEFGNIQDCCTTANHVFFKLARELKIEDCNVFDVERANGVIIIDGEENDHEWLKICGAVVDITSEQFEGWENTELIGEVIDFASMKGYEVEEVETICNYVLYNNR